MLRGKPGKTQSWLPNQVAYGVDTSDPDPKNWKPFGDELERVQRATAELAKHQERKPAA
jgi:hypothetical protein